MGRLNGVALHKWVGADGVGQPRWYRGSSLSSLGITKDMSELFYFRSERKVCGQWEWSKN